MIGQFRKKKNVYLTIKIKYKIYTNYMQCKQQILRIYNFTNPAAESYSDAGYHLFPAAQRHVAFQRNCASLIFV